MATLSLNIIKLPVKDLKRAVAFYRDKLGFQELFVVEEYGWGQLQRDQVPLALYLPGKGGGDRPVGGSADFHFSVDDIVELAKEWMEKGADLGQGLVSGDDTTVFLEFPDSEGNVLKVIQQPKEG